MADKRSVLYHLHQCKMILTNDDRCYYKVPYDVYKEVLRELLEEQELKTGHWTTKRTQEHDGEWYCDICGYEPQVFENTPFCPNCGIRMEQHVWNKAVK